MNHLGSQVHVRVYALQVEMGPSQVGQAAHPQSVPQLDQSTKDVAVASLHRHQAKEWENPIPYLIVPSCPWLFLFPMICQMFLVNVYPVSDFLSPEEHHPVSCSVHLSHNVLGVREHVFECRLDPDSPVPVLRSVPHPSAKKKCVGHRSQALIKITCAC